MALPRDWIHRNKTTTDNPVTDALDLAVKGVDDAISYASRSLWNAVVTVYTTMNLSTWWPVTAIAWINGLNPFPHSIRTNTASRSFFRQSGTAVETTAGTY